MRMRAGVAAMCVSAFLILGAYAYWWQHPDLTKMQMFREVWGNWVGAGIFLILGSTLLGYSRK